MSLDVLYLPRLCAHHQMQEPYVVSIRVPPRECERCKPREVIR